jgi:nucleoside-diphosphate-sugar epimerase
MRVFVTGATGFIGSVLVQELIGAGHQVVGLARSDEAAARLALWGAEARRGDLADTDGLATAARASDGVIHLAFGHDFSAYAAAVEADRLAVEALVGALAGSGKPLVVASGTMMIAHARPGTENDAPMSLEVPRAASEELVRTASGVRGSIVRLSPVVHDRGGQGLLTRIIPLAREKGVSAYVGDGANRWPAVHRLDAARLFVLALERAEPGSRLHAVAEERIAMRTIAETIGEGLGVPVRSVSVDESPAYFEGFAAFMTIDNPTSSALTREALGWRPREAGLLAGLRDGGYLS